VLVQAPDFFTFRVVFTLPFPIFQVGSKSLLDAIATISVSERRVKLRGWSWRL